MALNMVRTVGSRKEAKSVCEAVFNEKDELNVIIDGLKLENHNNKFLREKFTEIFEIIDMKNLLGFDIRIQTNGGGNISRASAAKLALCKAILKYYTTYGSGFKKEEIKNKLMSHDRQCLVVDRRRQEAKKFGRSGARARYTKSYR